MASLTRKVYTGAALVAATSITQFSFISPTHANDAMVRPQPSPMAMYPTFPEGPLPSPRLALPMPEAGSGQALAIPELLLHWPWLNGAVPSNGASTEPLPGIGGQFTSNCTACETRQMPVAIRPR